MSGWYYDFTTRSKPNKIRPRVFRPYGNILRTSKHFKNRTQNTTLNNYLPDLLTQIYRYNLPKSNLPKFTATYKLLSTDILVQNTYCHLLPKTNVGIIWHYLSIKLCDMSHTVSASHTTDEWTHPKNASNMKMSSEQIHKQLNVLLFIKKS